MTRTAADFHAIEPEGPFGYKPERTQPIQPHFPGYQELNEDQTRLLLRVRDGLLSECIIETPGEVLFVEHSGVGYTDEVSKQKWGYKVRRLRKAQPAPVAARQVEPLVRETSPASAAAYSQHSSIASGVHGRSTLVPHPRESNQSLKTPHAQPLSPIPPIGIAAHTTGGSQSRRIGTSELAASLGAPVSGKTDQPSTYKHEENDSPVSELPPISKIYTDQPTEIHKAAQKRPPAAAARPRAKSAEHFDIGPIADDSLPTAASSFRESEGQFEPQEPESDSWTSPDSRPRQSGLGADQRYSLIRVLILWFVVIILFVQCSMFLMRY